MKEIIGKTRKAESVLPRKLVVNNVTITTAKDKAKHFNNFFTNIGPNLAKNIPTAAKPFQSYISQVNTTMSEYPLSINELKEAFFSLKSNKSPGYDEINFNIVRKCFGQLNKPLMYLFSMSLENGIFPDSLKLAKVTPLFKNGNAEDINNYRPISVLPCFSKILERIMYNRLYKYLTKEKILYSKQFGFQKGHSTDHAILKLTDQIYESFENNQYTLGVFIDLSKAFDTVDHSILIQKLELHGIKGLNLAWFKNYLTNRKQCIKIDENTETDKERIQCGVPQGSILGPLLFLLYVNDLPNSSNSLDPIMFADDTNLFFKHENIHTLFSTVNKELNNINEWSKANKLSLNVKKTKYSLFHKSSKQDDIPLVLPKLKISNYEIERVQSKVSRCYFRSTSFMEGTYQTH